MEKPIFKMIISLHLSPFSFRFHSYEKVTSFSMLCVSETKKKGNTSKLWVLRAQTAAEKSLKALVTLYLELQVLEKNLIVRKITKKLQNDHYPQAWSRKPFKKFEMNILIKKNSNLLKSRKYQKPMKYLHVQFSGNISFFFVKGCKRLTNNTN